MRILFLIMFLSFGMQLVTCGEDNEMNKIKIIPEPEPNAIKDGEYTADVSAMKKYYNSLFASKTAEETINFLQEQNTDFKFNSKNELLFFPRKNFPLLLASYSCVVTLTFDKGVFESTQDISLCGLDAL